MEDFHPLVNGYQILRFSGNKRPRVETPSGLLGSAPPPVIKIYSVLSTRCRICTSPCTASLLTCSGYCPSWGRGRSASGSLKSLISSVNGWFISSIRKIELETTTAQSTRAKRTVALRGCEEDEAVEQHTEPDDDHHQECCQHGLSDRSILFSCFIFRLSSPGKKRGYLMPILSKFYWKEGTGYITCGICRVMSEKPKSLRRNVGRSEKKLTCY